MRQAGANPHHQQNLVDVVRAGILVYQLNCGIGRRITQRVTDMPLAQHEMDASPVAGEIELWPQLKLSPQHERQWSEFKACMLWAVPSFSDIWLAMMVDKYCDHAWFTDRIPTAATDDKYLYINAEWFFALTLDEQLFVACHEVEHAMYGHAGTGYALGKAGEIRYNDGVVLPYDGDLMNIAMDYVINDQLVASEDRQDA